MMASNTEMLACAERELRYRKRVYKRLVEERRMSLPQLDHELRTMEAIAEHFRKLIEIEQPNLFQQGVSHE